MGKYEGKRPFEKPRLRWGDNIEIYLQEFGWGSWIGLIWLTRGICGGFL
jgi:hypothetical protein